MHAKSLPQHLHISLTGVASQMRVTWTVESSQIGEVPHVCARFVAAPFTRGGAARGVGTIWAPERRLHRARRRSMHIVQRERNVRCACECEDAAVLQGPGHDLFGRNAGVGRPRERVAAPGVRV